MLLDGLLVLTQASNILKLSHFTSVLSMFHSDEYKPDSVSAEELLYMSDDPYTPVLAMANRLNNLLIRAGDEDAILEDLCRIFREREFSMHYSYILQSLIPS